MFVTAIDIGIAAFEHFTADIGAHRRRHFGIGWPKIFQIDINTVSASANRRGREISRHCALKRIGNDERRRSEEVRAHIRRHPAFEITIA